MIEPQVAPLQSVSQPPSTERQIDPWNSIRPKITAPIKTLKYHPGFPGRFHDINAASAFCRTFFPWYNTEHRHDRVHTAQVAVVFVRGTQSM